MVLRITGSNNTKQYIIEILKLWINEYGKKNYRAHKVIKSITNILKHLLSLLQEITCFDNKGKVAKRYSSRDIQKLIT